LQRLFSIFPNGWPGAGLLVLRIASGEYSLADGIAMIAASGSRSPGLLALTSAIPGGLLIVGLWTPVCTWTYLNDQPAAHDIMDHAVENASGYIARHPDFSDKKLLSRIKSVLKRRARQIATKQRREILYGLFVDMEDLYVVQPEVEQRIYAYELFERLSPLHKQLWTGVRWIILGGRSLQRSSWTTPQSGVRLIGR